MVPWCRSLRPALVLCALTLSLPALAQSPAQSPGPAPASVPYCEPWIGRLISYQGTISTRRASGFQQASVRLNEIFCVGDVLEIGSFSRAALQLPDQTVVRLDQGTVVTFAAPQDDKRTWLEILKGAVHIISRDPRALRVITPFANAGIEGTEFFVGVGADSATVLVFEGRVKVQNASGAATAGSGESVLAKAGSAPVLQQVVRPRDAVVWTLYYPPTSVGPLPSADAEPTAAQQTPDFFIARAEQRLAVGQVTEAEADLNRALALAPGSGEVLARQSVIALTRNDTAVAAGLASKAVAAAPDSVAARLAESYVRQATTDFPGAISDLEAAAAAHPDNALVRARLAELWLGAGEVDRSEENAKAAVAADPTLGLAQTILGFVRLTRIQLDAAAATFEEAIRLQPDAPLPRLGLGLTKIRHGDLVAGRAEMEAAVILDPANSLIRSYMGKTYYEVKDAKLAASQYGLAKELDPKDPTPWFYDAILRQTVNDPVGAVQALQQSVDLNDNRAMYRSRLLLDQDLAARSASLGRVYRTLGFDELGLREAWKSVSTDPRDYSGHRFLADSYASLPRYEIARVNELLQSQLLQPLNTTVVQPQLGEANLFILDTSGPSAVGFNEFNPLFASNGLQGQVSGVVGGNSTSGADAVLTGIHDQWSFSLGGYHYQTDGFRTNNDVDATVGNLLVQYQFSPETSLLAEARTSHQDQGELRLRFDPGAFDSSLPRESADSTTLHLGLRHDLSPRSTLVTLVTYESRSAPLTLADPPASGDFDTDNYSGEVQYLYRSDFWNVISGVRYASGKYSDSFTIFGDTTASTTRPKNFSAYMYGTADIGETLQLTVGLSRDDINDAFFDRSRWNPKGGLTWHATEDTTIRVGAFSTLQRLTPSRQDVQPSLEPTAVAGFNQFFFGSEAEDAHRYGLGIDQRFSATLWGGAEVSRRQLDVPYESFDTLPPLKLSAKVREDAARGYLYWSATPRIAASLGYEYDYAKNDPAYLPNFVASVETNQFPFRLGYFDPRGPIAAIQPIFARQRGRFQDTSAPPFPLVSDSDQFWVVNALIGYRLPRRSGLISLDVRNIFDSHFKFQDVDPENPRIYPERVVLLKATLAL